MGLDNKENNMFIIIPLRKISLRCESMIDNLNIDLHPYHSIETKASR